MSFLENTFISVLNMSITASYIAIAVIIARLLLKKAPRVFSYALWSVVLFRLLCPFSFSSAFSLMGLINPDQAGTSIQYIRQDIGRMELPKVNTGVDSINSAINALLPAANPAASVNPMQIQISLVTFVWQAGVAVLLIYAAIAYLRLKKQISMATLVSDNIYETDRIRSPFVCGFVKPRIYLPAGLAMDQREYILCHEQAHIRRRDYLVKPVAFLALALHWFNPLMWLCFTLMTKDMEMSCDEQVIRKAAGKEVTGYSSSLLALAVSGRMPGPGPLAFGESNVKERIKNILDYKKPAFRVIVTSVIAVLVLVAALASNPIGGTAVHGPSGEGKKGVSSYDVEALMKNKTQYIGNNSRVVALIDALPLPEGVNRGAVQLATSEAPYGLTINYSLEDDAVRISEEQFLRNSMLLFALIDNVEVVSHQGHWKNKSLSSIPFNFTYTRADAEKVVNGDVRQFALDKERLAELIDIIQLLKEDKTKTAMKGLELYVWRKPELTGNNGIYYTLLQWTNWTKTEDEIYNLSSATTKIEDINREIAAYGEMDIFVSHPMYISKEEMSRLADQIEIENGSIAVGTGWFDREENRD